MKKSCLYIVLFLNCIIGFSQPQSTKSCSNKNIFFCDKDGFIEAVDLEYGHQIWRKKFGRVSKSILSYQNNLIFVTNLSINYINSTNGDIIYQIHADSLEKKYLSQKNIYKGLDRVYFSPIEYGIKENKLFVGGKCIFEIDLKQGIVINKYLEKPESNVKYYNLALIGNNIYFADYNGIGCFNIETKEQLWYFENKSTHSAFKIVEEKMYFSSTKKIFCLNRLNGQLLWQKEGFNPKIDAKDYMIPFCINNQYLFYLQENQIIKTNLDTGSEITSIYAPDINDLGSNGKFLFWSSNSDLVKFDYEKQKKLWTYKTFFREDEAKIKYLNILNENDILIEYQSGYAAGRTIVSASNGISKWEIRGNYDFLNALIINNETRFKECSFSRLKVKLSNKDKNTLPNYIEILVEDKTGIAQSSYLYRNNINADYFPTP